MKHKLTGLFLIIGTVLTGSCGIAGQYASSGCDDDIYYRPDAESRSRMVADARAEAERRNEMYTDQYVANDDEGRLWLVTEQEDGTYASRLHRFDSPVYSFNYNFGVWGDPWYNPWWGPYRYYPGYAYDYWYYRWGDPWYWNDPWYWGDPWPYRPWHWGYHGWNYYWDYNFLPGPAIGHTYNKNLVYTPRTSRNSGIYRTGGSSSPTATRTTSTVGSTTRRTSSPSLGKSGVVRTTNSNRNSGSGSTYTTRSSSGSSYSSGVSRSTSSSSGSSSGGGRPSSGTGTHTGGGRR
ncbi:MAG: hypothetical protein KBT00_05420 [Bacteroidales bacterium]|nr:hypothetical protein [Candidatus Cacconaster merdequi]